MATEMDMKMYHCRQPMIRRRDPAGWYCLKCKANEPDVVKVRAKIIPQDEFDADLSDKKVIALVVVCSIIGAGLIVLYALLFGR